MQAFFFKGSLPSARSVFLLNLRACDCCGLIVADSFVDHRVPQSVTVERSEDFYFPQSLLRLSEYIFNSFRFCELLIVVQIVVWGSAMRQKQLFKNLITLTASKLSFETAKYSGVLSSLSAFSESDRLTKRILIVSRRFLLQAQISPVM